MTSWVQIPPDARILASTQKSAIKRVPHVGAAFLIFILKIWKQRILRLNKLTTVGVGLKMHHTQHRGAHWLLIIVPIH